MVKNPLYAFLAFLIVEGAVAAGFISQDMANAAKLQLEDAIFYVILAITALLGFRQYLDAHKHQVTKQTESITDKPVVSETTITIDDSVKNIEPSLPLFTEQGAGTPPVDNANLPEQDNGSLPPVQQ